jgi:glycosidase
MNYRFQKALLGFFADETLDTKGLDHTLRQIMLDYPEQATAVMLNLLGSHDTARPMTVAKGNVESLKLMAALQFTFEGAPCIYYGDEIGMEGGKDPDCRRCYPWDKPEKQNRELLAYYKKLIAIRKANPALRAGTFHPFIVDNERGLYAFERRANGNHCLVALNRSNQDHKIKLPGRVRATDLLTNHRLDGAEAIVPGRKALILGVES